MFLLSKTPNKQKQYQEIIIWTKLSFNRYFWFKLLFGFKGRYNFTAHIYTCIWMWFSVDWLLQDDCRYMDNKMLVRHKTQNNQFIYNSKMNPSQEEVWHTLFLAPDFQTLLTAVEMEIFRDISALYKYMSLFPVVVLIMCWWRYHYNFDKC
mgnify:CR=1 FL=1